MVSNSFKKHNKDSYNKIAYEYLSSHIDKTPDYLIDIISSLPENLRILDIGSGPGNNIPLLQSRKPKIIVCLDNSPKMLLLAKRNFNTSNIKYVETDFMKYETNEKFDFIFSHLSFVHLPPKDLTLMLKKVYNMLYKNSYFFANYFIGGMNEFKLIPLDHSTDGEETRYFGIYKKKYIEDRYKETGFNIIQRSIYKGHHFTRYNIFASPN